MVEVPAGCTSSACQVTVSGTLAYGVAVDGKGNVVIPDLTGSQVVEINRSQAPALNFAATNVGVASSDSPQTVTVENIGNQPLSAASAGLVVNGPNFAAVAGPGVPADCTANFTLGPGQACGVSISFKPQAGGNPLSSTAVLTDNALNAAPATQTIALSGVAVSASYALTVTEVGTGAGTVTDNQGQVSCSEANSAVTGTCGGSYPGGAVVTLTAQAAGTSAFLGWGGACAASGTSSTCNVLMSAAMNATASFSNQSFGNVNVCPAGSSSPAPCSASLTLTYNLATTTTIGAVQVVTQGANGLDFTAGAGSTCTGAVFAGNSCTVNINFAPLGPGLRMGAVELFDNNANLLATTPVYGIGQEPEIAFGPGTQSTVAASGLSANTRGVAVDAAGNVFIADYQNNKVVKVTPGGAQTTVTATGLNGPAGIAVDGAGDVFIAQGGGVVEVTPLGVESAVSTPGFTLSQPSAVAVDGAGDLFIADTGNNRLVEVPANGGNVTTLGTGLAAPAGVAVDGYGGVYIADTGNHRVLKLINGAQIAVNSTLTSPSAVAVDAAGDVFIADAAHNTVVEVTAGGVQTLVSATPGAAQPYAVAVDGAGDVFIADAVPGQVVKLNRSQAPGLSFAATNVGSTSIDSPQTVTVQNIGNQPLTGSLALSLGANFAQSASPDCSGAFPLGAGAMCSESFSFVPQGASFFTGAAVFSDNTLNSVSAAVQTISLSGTGQTGQGATTVAVPDVTGQTQGAAATPITGAGLVVGTVTTAASSTVPSGSVISQSPAAGTQVAVGSAVNLLVSSGHGAGALAESAAAGEQLLRHGRLRRRGSDAARQGRGRGGHRQRSRFPPMHRARA